MKTPKKTLNLNAQHIETYEEVTAGYIWTTLAGNRYISNYKPNLSVPTYIEVTSYDDDEHAIELEEACAILEIAVERFMVLGEQLIHDTELRLTHVDDDVIDLGKRLLEEETREACEALDKRDLPALADALADIIYVAVWNALRFDIPIGKVFQAVQNANMRKFPDGKVLRDEHGKVMKPPGWVGPEAEIKAILEQYHE